MSEGKQQFRKTSENFLYSSLKFISKAATKCHEKCIFSFLTSGRSINSGHFPFQKSSVLVTLLKQISVNCAKIRMFWNISRSMIPLISFRNKPQIRESGITVIKKKNGERNRGSFDVAIRESHLRRLYFHPPDQSSTLSWVSIKMSVQRFFKTLPQSWIAVK